MIPVRISSLSILSLRGFDLPIPIVLLLLLLATRERILGLTRGCGGIVLSYARDHVGLGRGRRWGQG